MVRDAEKPCGYYEMPMTFAWKVALIVRAMTVVMVLVLVGVVVTVPVSCIRLEMDVRGMVSGMIMTDGGT